MKNEKRFLKPIADIIEFEGDLDTIGTSDPFDETGEFEPGQIP